MKIKNIRLLICYCLNLCTERQMVELPWCLLVWVEHPAFVPRILSPRSACANQRCSVVGTQEAALLILGLPEWLPNYVSPRIILFVFHPMSRSLCKRILVWCNLSHSFFSHSEEESGTSICVCSMVLQGVSLESWKKVCVLRCVWFLSLIVSLLSKVGRL